VLCWGSVQFRWIFTKPLTILGWRNENRSRYPFPPIHRKNIPFFLLHFPFLVSLMFVGLILWVKVVALSYGLMFSFCSCSSSVPFWILTLHPRSSEFCKLTFFFFLFWWFFSPFVLLVLFFFYERIFTFLVLAHKFVAIGSVDFWLVCNGTIETSPLII